MPRSLSSLIPNADDLLALHVENVAELLLIHLASLEGEQGNTVFQHGRIIPNNFFNELDRSLNANPEYGPKQSQVNKALLEAWAWLKSEGLLVSNPLWSGACFLSRRAERLKTREDFEAFRKARLLPKDQIHPVIAQEVYSLFLTGKYDTAIFEAFRQVEIAVRTASGLAQELVGVDLMRVAFTRAKNNQPAGPLADPSLPAGEQEGMAHLFAGAFSVYRNSTGHRYVPPHAESAAEVIMLASQLLRIVDRLKTAGQNS